MTTVGEPVALPRSETEKIWVSLSEWQGFLGIDIRVYYQAGEASWRPTKKGVRISLELKDQLIAAIEKVAGYAGDAMGESKGRPKPLTKSEEVDEDEEADE
ncbi:MAG: transcriptional coactivator p15/PC4 family protein [Promethearchaeota archaeon]